MSNLVKNFDPIYKSRTRLLNSVRPLGKAGLLAELLKDEVESS